MRAYGIKRETSNVKRYLSVGYYLVLTFDA